MISVIIEELVKLILLTIIVLLINYILVKDFKKLIKRLKKAHNIKEALIIIDKYFFG